MNAERKLWERGGDKKPATYGVIRHPEFADRLTRTADMNPNVPPMRSGRLTYVQSELHKLGQDVSLESVRKWFSGEAMPHKDRAELLAQVLTADANWLLLGAEPGETPQARRTRNAMADGAVNVVAGLAQRDGAIISFPDPEDRYEMAQHVDLRAVIRGANYPLHVIVGEEEGGKITFAVPTDLRNTVPLGVVWLEGFNVGVYEITDEAIELGTRGTRGKILVDLHSHGVREITSFKDRF